MIDSSSASMFTLIKSLLRPDHATPEQKEQGRMAAAWLNDHIGQVRRYTQNEYATLLGLVWDHYTEHKECPNREILGYEVAQEADAGLTTLWCDFVESDLADHSGWVRHEPEDLDTLWSVVVEEAKQHRMVKMLQNAVIIATKGVELKKGGEKVLYKGPDASIRYLWERVDAIEMGTPGGDRGHRIDMANAQVRDIAEKLISPKEGTRIHTGLRVLDEQIGLRKGMLCGVLGFTGSRKSSLARTIAYGAAMSGTSCLWVCLEMSRNEEVLNFLVIHAEARFHLECRDLGVTKLDAFRGKLSERAKHWLLHEVKDDLASSLDSKDGRGSLRILKPSANDWPTISGEIKGEDLCKPIDLLVIDHPKCIQLPGRNPRTEVAGLATDLKDLAASWHDGAGLLTIVPIQSNRDGWREAGKADGVWEITGIYEDSALGMWSDLIIGIYSNDEMEKASQVKISVPKIRTGVKVAPFLLNINQVSNTLTDHAEVVERELNAVYELL